MSNYLQKEDLEEIMEIVDTFELQDLYTVLGEDNFIDVMTIINGIQETDDKIIMLGALDKLLNTSKTGIVEFDDVFLTRKKTEREKKDEVIELLINERLRNYLDEFLEHNPQLSDVDNVIRAYSLVSSFNMFDFSVDTARIDIRDKEIVDYLVNNDIDIEEFINTLQNCSYDELEDFETPLELIKYVNSK